MGIALKLLQSMQAEGIFLHLTDDGNLGYEAQRSLTSEEIDRLKDNKSQLVTLLKASVSNDDTSLKPTPQCSISQENMYLLCQQSSINASYNLCFSLCFEQQPDIERLKNALAFIQTQQPALRSGFERQDGDVVMVRRAVDEVPFESIQLLEKDYDSWLNKVSQTPFDLSSPPLWKFVFVETEHTRRLVIVVHHIVWDGWSSALFREKLSQAYGQNLSAAEAQEHSGSDRFAQHQRDASEQGEWQQSREYWKTLLASAPMQNEWLTRKAPKSSLAGHVEHHIGIEQINHVQPHQRFNALLSAWFLALGRQYRCNRMVLGVAVANRDCHSELESSLGYFNNVVPVIQNHLLTTPAKQLMESVKGQWLGSIAHQGVPFGHIVNSAQRERNSHENPLTQVVIGYQSFDWDEDYAQLPHTLEAAKNSHAKLPLSIQMATINGKLTINVEYDPHWYEEAEVHTLLSRFDRALHELSLDFESEPEQAWMKGAELSQPQNLPRNLAEMLEKTAQRHPEKLLTFVTVDGVRSSLTYSQLYHEAKITAGRLQQGKNWSHAGRPVIVLAADLHQYLVNFWGVVIAGGQPATINAPQVETQEGLTKIYDAFVQLNQALIVCCEAGKEAIANLQQQTDDVEVVVPSQLPSQNYVQCEIDENSPGIIQLSSGSTGKSKCIQQSHHTIVEYCDLITQSREQRSTDVSLNWMGFDHVGGLLFTHLRDTYLGCEQVHVSTPYVLRSPLRWLALVEECKVTHSWCPNFAYKMMISEAESSEQRYDLSLLKELINGGEMVVAETVRRFIEVFTPWGLKSNVLTPAFGMAESCTVISTKPVSQGEAFSLNSYAIDSQDEYTQIGHSEFVSLGQAVANTEIRIANEHNEVVKEFEVGKMQLRGPSITMGYFESPDLNQKAFVGDGWFDTGDCGVIAEGELYLTGRMQESIVLNGMNFFNHDIEALVGSVDGVDETSVAVVGYQDRGDSAVVFYVATSQSSLHELEDRIRRLLGEKLQFYPTELVKLESESFLKTTAGKIQRRKMVERWLKIKALNDNPIEMVRLLPAPISQQSLERVSPISMSDLLGGHACPNRTVVAVMESDIEQLMRGKGEIQQTLQHWNTKQLVLLVEKALGPIVELWVQAFQTMTIGTSIQVITCHLPQHIQSLPKQSASKRLDFDGVNGVEDREFMVDWRQAHAPQTLKTESYSVVTGASGGIAYHLIQELANQGEFVVLLSRSKPEITNTLLAEQYLWIRTDFTGESSLEEDWQECRADTPQLKQAPRRVYHLAAQFHRDSIDDLDLGTLAKIKAVNEGGLNKLVSLLRAYSHTDSIQWLVFGSLNGVRGGPQSLSYNLSQAATRSAVDMLRKQGVSASWLGWSGWEETGMSVGEVDTAALKQAGLQSLQANDCMNMLPNLIALPAGDYLIGTKAKNAEVQPTEELSPSETEGISQAHLASLRQLWQELLGRNDIPDNQSFFELGGSSILLYKLQHLIEKELGYKNVTMADLFSAPTLQSMALMLTRLTPQEATPPLVKESLDKETRKTRNASVKERFKRRMNK